MVLAVGPITQNSVGSNTASLTVAAATGGNGPYTYQWYRSPTGTFSPGVGTLISGATSLTLNDTGLIPNSQYYYEVVVTDTGNSNATANSAELSVVTTAQQLSQNAFTMTTIAGVVDPTVSFGGTIPVMVDASEVETLYPGDPVMIVDSAGGVPKVTLCTADSDECLGFVNYNIKTVGFVAGDAMEISIGGNTQYLYATGAIARGVEVVLDRTNNGVKAANGSGGENIVGWAYDKATALGQLIRVRLKTPSFLFDA